MNDTHRTNTTIRDIVDRLHRDSQPAAPSQRVGDKTAEVRDALNKQTTLPNSVDWRESVAAVLRGLHAGRDDSEAPSGWREWYTEALEDVADALALPNDSGKSGEREAIGENGDTGSPDVRNDAVRDENTGSVHVIPKDGQRYHRFPLPQPPLPPVETVARMLASYGQDADAPHDPARAMVNAAPRPETDVAGWAIRMADLERERDTARDLAVLFRDELRTQTDLVDRLTDAVEREASDIGGEGSMTVLRLLGPNLVSAKAALATEGMVATADAKEAAHYAAVGGLKEQGEDYDPTPEAQAETFQAIKAEPRPSADRIRAMLVDLEREARWIGGESHAWGSTWTCAAAGLDGASYAVMTRAAATMIDSLGIHCLALEMERDGLSAQLDRIADQAKPIDGTDLAELVQQATRFADHLGTTERMGATVIRRMVAAVNDQGRRLRDETNARQKSQTLSDNRGRRGELLQARLLEAEGLLAEALPSVRLVNDWATWTDSSLYAYADAILRKVLPDAPARDSIVDALAEIRKVARGRLGDNGFTIPPSYDDDQRANAAEVVRSRAAQGRIKEHANPGAPDEFGTATLYGPTVDAVASALGLVRAQ